VSPLREVARLGCTAFGGPAVHIAMLREEVVTRRKWMSDEEFVDLLGATNLIPGPNSTEMVMHAGFVRGAWLGFLIGGALFILPAALIVLAIAWPMSRGGSCRRSSGCCTASSRSSSRSYCRRSGDSCVRSSRKQASRFSPSPHSRSTFSASMSWCGGWSGAALATIGIFLPAFVFVAITHPLVPRMRRSPVLAALLDGVNAGALALMAGVTVQITRAAIVDAVTATLAIVAAIVLLRWKINSAWLVLGGAAVGISFQLLSRV